MFSRLQGFVDQTEFAAQQQVYFNTLPNIIPSPVSGLQGFDKAIQTTGTNGYQDPAIGNPNKIFMQVPSADLSKQAAYCTNATLESLPNNDPNSIGCGWLYSPPNRNSPYPNLSQGALGDKSGPSPAFDHPSHRKWFFDLQEAKKQVLFDKCKALKACTDLDSAVFNGICGFCSDTNQGVPIDTVGKPLYNDPRTSCTTIITDKGQCPPPPSGPQPMIDRTCEPIDDGKGGRQLSMDCIRQTFNSGGCKKGTLALALGGSSRNVDDVANSEVVSLYNRVANPTLNMSIFQDRHTTVNTVLQEARNLAANANKPANSAIGAAARDLCLQRGAINGYNPCAELTDSSTGPHDMKCLQQFFLKAGGNQQGSDYPNPANISKYNSMGTLGTIKQYWAGLTVAMQGKKIDSFMDGSNATNYKKQSNALMRMKGITPDALIVRTPYKQGVEVFWFVATPSQPGKVAGFLRRTIEPKIIQFDAKPSGAPQIGGVGYRCMVQLTDLRAPVDFSAKFQVIVDDGFWISVNNPAAIDEEAMQKYGTVDKPGLFENLGLQGPTPYNSQACTPFHTTTPNIMKLYHEDAGGGWEAFKFGVNACVGTPKLDSMYLSLTCEPRAPFLRFEVSHRGRFEELRHPGLFNQFIKLEGVDYPRASTDERKFVPGNKAFVRINSASSEINLENIAYQSWKTMTIALRIQTTTVDRESLIELACGPVGSWYFNVIAIRSGEGTVGIQIECNVGNGIQTISTGFQLNVQSWYLFQINNIGNGFVLFCDTINTITANKRMTTQSKVISAGKQLWLQNATWTPTPGQNYEVCNVLLGILKHKGWSGMYATGPFTYDVAWVHFFQDTANDNDIYRDAMTNWVYTQFPSEYDKYS